MPKSSSQNSLESVELPKVSGEIPNVPIKTSSDKVSVVNPPLRVSGVLGFEVSDPKPETASADDPTFFDHWSPRQRTAILLVVASSTFLLPMGDTAYMPSLTKLEVDLHTTPGLVALTVALFALVCGVVPLVTGPLADRYGRFWILFGSLVFFTATSVACTFSPNIGGLLALRVLQAAGVSSTLTLGSGILSDVYPPSQRGFAFGIFGIPLQVGPILGPIVGGALANAYGWRSTFVLIAILAAIMSVLVFFLVPETLHYLVAEQDVKRAQREAAAAPKQPTAVGGQGDEKASAAEPAAAAGPLTNPIPKPKLAGPWEPLLFLRFPMFAWLAWTVGVGMAACYLTIVIFPIIMAVEYGLDELLIGLAYLPFGVGGMLGSQVGGTLCKILQKKYLIKESQIVVFLTGLIFVVPSLVLFGWTQHYHISAPMVTSAGVGFGLSWCFGAALSYATQWQPEQAGGVTSCLQLVQFGLSCVCIAVGATLSDVVGNGPLFTFMAGLLLVSLVPGGVYVILVIRRSERARRNEANSSAPETTAATNAEKPATPTSTSEKPTADV
eukprot:TRINITY_DN4145_c0_g1_i2.p1 TRINITY_DN4145_c0_g1~~TRINITY_DN4145_c0_g1_i2.p1  ORF type:complete len:555 (+),score=158.31 TRINITY_DN4145_c0_g1_i2:122-1786(+)